jgi:Lipocalin-like domain
MNRRTALTLTTTVLAGVALSAGEAMAQQGLLKEQLVGTLTLVSTEATAANGTKQQYFGANPRGILMLDASGRYAQVWGRADRAKFKASGNLRLDTPAAEYGEAARAFVGNFGTWTVNEADKTLTQRYEAALIPNVEGTEAKVSVNLAGDELKFVATSATGERTDTVYRRAK